MSSRPALDRLQAKFTGVGGQCCSLLIRAGGQPGQLSEQDKVFIPATLIDHQDQLRYMTFVYQALLSAKAGSTSLFLRALDAAEKIEKIHSPIVTALQVWAQLIEGRYEEALQTLERAGEEAGAIGDFDLCLNAFAELLILDLMFGCSRVNDAEAVQKVAGFYELASRTITKPDVCHTKSHDKVRIGIVAPLLHRANVPYAKRAIDFAKFIDYERFDLFVYSSEGLALNSSALPSAVMEGGTLESECGPSLVRELERYGAKVYINGIDHRPMASAKRLAEKFEEDQVDVLIIQSGPTVPVDWLSARLTSVPVKLHIHIGIANYIPDFDYTLFDNYENLKRELATWPTDCGEAVLLRRGTDLSSIDAAPPRTRAELGIPSSACVMGCVSNNFATRFSEEFAHALGQAMKSEANLWFLPVGSRQLPEGVNAIFDQYGVGERVCHVGHSDFPATELKVMDFYVADFPHGGSQAVVEALACSLPVVAMRCGSTHYESISADVAGPTAITEYDVARYSSRILSLTHSTDLRKKEAEASRKRAEDYFSVQQYVENITTLGTTILRRKSGEAVSEDPLVKGWEAA